jgi:hypothetical protein
MIALGTRFVWAAVPAAILAVCSVKLLYRFGHLALCGQFVLLWALALYFTNQRDRRVRLVEHILLSAFSMLTNTYLFAMVTGIQISTFVAARRQGALAPSDRRSLMLGLAAVLAIGVAAGFGTLLLTPAGIRAEGFGRFSWNIATLVIPPWWRAVPRDATGGQYEGESYIGLGAIVLLVAAIVTGPRAAIEHLRRHWTLWVALVAMAIFAASNRVYLSSLLIIDLPLHGPVAATANIFRASGRFVWPLAYTLGPVALARILRGRRVVAVPLVLLATLVQLGEVLPVIRVVHSMSAEVQPDVIDTPTLERWMATHQRVWQYPSYFCNEFSGSTNVNSAEATRQLRLQLLAARSGLPNNSVYMSRSFKDCVREARWADTAELGEGVLHVIEKQKAAASPALAALTVSGACKDIGWTLVCSREKLR